MSPMYSNTNISFLALAEDIASRRWILVEPAYTKGDVPSKISSSNVYLTSTINLKYGVPILEQRWDKQIVGNGEDRMRVHRT